MSSKLLSLSFTCLSFAASAHAAAQALQVAKLQSECGMLYTTVAGDGCWAIATNARITQKQLQALNPALNCDTLAVGDGLCLELPCSKRYEVKNGEWCAKIQDEQKVSEADLLSLNPGLICSELFPGQHLCLAPPEVTPPTNGTTPTLPTTPTDPVPTIPCDVSLPVAVGDTCPNLASRSGIQLGQFNAMNKNLDCANLQPGDFACIKPACSEFYRVQQGDTCQKVETEYSMAKDQLVTLNPGLSCTEFVQDQLLCVGAPPEEQPEQPSTGLVYRDEYPMFSPGDSVPQSRILSFINSPSPRDSFFGDLVFQQDNQHQATFARLDANGDGKLGLDELKEIFSANPGLVRGMNEVDKTISHDNFVERVMEHADLNKDGFVDVQEYMSAIYSSQNLTNYATDVALMGETGLAEKRAIPLVVAGIVGLIGLFVGMSFADLMRELERKSKIKAGDMLKYLEITDWDRGNEPEPKCAAYMYYSTSCAALGHHWSSHCSEGGEKVFDSSCRKPFADGAKACGFLGCSSLCYKVNTDGCDCDALKYSAEEGVAYDDPPLTTTDESGVGACRKKCRGVNNCVGFSVAPGKNDRRVTCKTFGLMALKVSRDRTASFMLSPSCPVPPEGFHGISFAELMRSQLIGAIISNIYAEKHSISLGRRQKSDECILTPPKKREFSDLYESHWNTTLEHIPVYQNLTRREPLRVDYRDVYPQTVKGQGPSSWCSAYTFTSVVEGTVMRTYKRSTNVPLSPLWIAWCRGGNTAAFGSWFSELYSKVGNSYLATESCMPFSLLRPSQQECISNGCAASQYGKLPYITNTVRFHPAFTGVGVFMDQIDKIKDHLANVGPVYMVFHISDGFQAYGEALRSSSKPENEMIYYDGHPSFPSTCAYGLHAMTVVGYGHYVRSTDPCGVKPRLYWIVLNSWGPSFGRNGHVFIELGSLSNTQWESWGVKVNEGSQWLTSSLPIF